MAGCVIKVCDCNVSMANTGTDCQLPIADIRKLILVPTYNSTGDLNYLDLSTPINLATFTSAINDTDSAQRYYPLPSLFDVNDTRNEPVTQTTSDDTVLFVRDGTRSFEGTIWGSEGSPTLAAKINRARCTPMSIWGVDRNGSLLGNLSSDGTKFYPKRIDQESIYAQFVPATPKTKQGVKIKFNFHVDESDACLKMIPSASMDGADLLTLRGLLDVHATYSNIATTGFTVKLETDYGDALSPTRVKGLTTPDFVSSATSTTSKIRRTNNTPADVSITVAEGTGTSQGIYTVTFGTAQSTADTLNPKIVKNGFDFTDVNDDIVTIP